MTSHYGPTPTLLFADLAPKLFIGLDLLSFNSTPNFHGFKDLTLGAHFLYSGATDLFSLREGEWIFIGDNGADETQGNAELQLFNSSSSQAQQPEIRLRKYDAEHESFAPFDESSTTGKQEAMRLRANIGEYWNNGTLLPYESVVHGKGAENLRRVQEQHEEQDQDQKHQSDSQILERADWPHLANHITPSALTRILGSPNLDSAGRRSWKISTGDSEARDADHIPSMTDNDRESKEAGDQLSEQGDSNLGFMAFDLKQTWPEGAIGRERTQAARDRSWLLSDLIITAARQCGYDGNESFGEQQILGELQFAFLMVLTLMNFSCLEQWKRLLEMIFSCRDAIVSREEFFVQVSRLLLLQLQHVNDTEGNIFEMDGDDGFERFKKMLYGFKTMLGDLPDDTALQIKAEFRTMEKWLDKTFGWRLGRGSVVRSGMMQLEDGEFVELDMDGLDEEDETGEYAPIVIELPTEAAEE